MLTEKSRAGQFLLAEANGTLSRERIIIASGQGVLPVGQVLGRITTEGANQGKYGKYSNADSTTGLGTAVAILYDEVDATTADAPGVGVFRHAEVKESELTGIDAHGKADLAPAHIIFR
ncbi:head decoration protein [Thauera butanivorans]|uniref:head decoration protein n=1 Tax=Thauera butanivorans TaxID=86174 RepID=UPI0008389EA7|nr:head decoration protein [Thauera butanivorans]